MRTSGSAAAGRGNDDPDDAELVARVADRDLAALRALYARHAPWLVLRLRRRCGDPDMVAEAVQDTFHAVWNGAGRYEARGEVAAWIWGIGIRRLIARMRRMPAPSPMAEETLTALVGGRNLSDATASAEDAVLVGIEHGDLHGALDRLAPELRSVVQATVLDGLTTREASHLLGIPAGTVKTRMRRARQMLRADLARGAIT
jgi:RNA polymerase sigma-70 factor (ECF subfamily)